MHETLTKITDQEKLELVKLLNKDYREATKDIQVELQEIYSATKYDDEGNIENEKEIDNKIKKILPIVVLLWLNNSNNITTTGENITFNTWLFYEYASVTKLKNDKVVKSVANLNKIAKNTVKQRKKLIKWNKVIKGNTRTLDKRLSKVIKKGLKQNKTEKQITKDVARTMRLNNGKAKSIARTETNYYRSDSKLQVGQYNETKGNILYKVWLYTYRSKEARSGHVAADLQEVKGVDSKFIVNGHETKAPQHFGIASEDINCSCDYRVDYEQELSVSTREYFKYKGNK